MRKKLEKNSFIILSFTLPCILFTYTLSPSITFGDSGELVAAAYTLGLSHPPGFSLWMILTKVVMTVVPVGSIAWRANLASALYASAALSLLFYLIATTAKPLFLARLQLSHFIAGFSAVLIFAVSPPLWSQAIVAEVYTLTLLLFVSQLIFLHLWIASNRPRWLYFFAFLAGVGIANHYVILAVYPAYFLYILIAKREIFTNPFLLIRAFLFFVLGLSVILYVPFRVFSDTSMNWGHMETWQDIADYLRRKQFGAGAYKYTDANIGIFVPVGDISSSSSLLEKIVTTPLYSARVLVQVFTPFLAFAGILGVALGAAKTKKSWRFSFATLLILCLFFAEYVFDVATTPSHTTIPAEALFFDRLIPHAVVTIGIAYLFMWCVNWIGKKNKYAAIFASLVLVLIPLYFGISRFGNFNWQHNTVARDHGINVLATLDEGATLFIDKNDWLFPLLYLATVENMRPDVTLVDRTGNLFEDEYRLSKIPITSEADLEKYRKSIDDTLIAQNPTVSYYYAADKDFERHGYDVVQSGTLYKFNGGESQETSDNGRDLFINEYSNIMSLDSVPWHDPDTAYIVSYYHMRHADALLAEGKRHEALNALQKAQSLAPETYLTQNQVGTYYGILDEYERAEEAYKKALSLRPTSPIAQKNLGVLLALMGHEDEAIVEIEKAISLEPADPFLYLRIAEIYEKKEDHAHALTSYLAAANIAPSVDVLSKVVVLSVKINDCQQAQQAALALPESVETAPLVNNVGVCWAQGGKYDNARVLWERALEIDPSYQNAKDNIEKLNAASL